MKDISESVIYYPKRLTNRDRLVNCHCLCHEGINEHGKGQCPCKVKEQMK